MGGARAVVQPSVARGVTVAPPSKSMAHRMLICAGLADGISHVSGIAPSEDVLATIDCLNALGASVSYQGETAVVQGIGAKREFSPATLACRECGSTLRFFIPLCLFTGVEMKLTGSGKLLSRPMGVYEELCRQHGFAYRQNAEGIMVNGKLTAGTYAVRGDISSQFITGLLLALALCDGDSYICPTSHVESRPYIDLTISAMQQFGIQVEWQERDVLHVHGGGYRPCDVAVEGDYSNAAFFDVFNVLGGEVHVEGLREESLQGDRVYRQYLPQLADGCPVIDLKDCPDLGPVLMAVAAMKHGATFTGTKRLKMKESDRGVAMAEELSKAGIAMTIEEDSIIVHEGSLHVPETPFYGHNDHRIVMALVTLLTVTGGSIVGVEAVRKSLPDYFDRIQSLGIEVEIEHAVDF